jgi:hypothetical protein
VDAEEKESFAALAEDSSLREKKMNRSGKCSMKQPEIHPEFSVTILGVLHNLASIVTASLPG